MGFNGTTIKALILLIGLLAYFAERIYKFGSVYGKEYAELTLGEVDTLTSDNYFELKGFVFSRAELEDREDGSKRKSIALYNNPLDSFSVVGLEIKNTSQFLEDLSEREKVIVKKGAGTWQLPTYQGNRLFGFECSTPEECEEYRQMFGEALFDEGVTKRIMLEYIPYENPSRYLPELGLLAVAIIFLLIIVLAGLNSRKKILDS